MTSYVLLAAISLVLIIFVVGGDVVRYYRRRARVQRTLDGMAADRRRAVALAREVRERNELWERTGDGGGV